MNEKKTIRFFAKFKDAKGDYNSVIVECWANDQKIAKEASIETVSRIIGISKNDIIIAPVIKIEVPRDIYEEIDQKYRNGYKE